MVVTINLTLSPEGIISKAHKAIQEQEITSIIEAIALQVEITDKGAMKIRYMNTEEVNEASGQNNKIYKDKIGVYRHELMYLGNEEIETADYLKSKGFKFIDMTPDEFKYYIELGVL